MFADDEPQRRGKPKWKYEFETWYNKRRPGEWIPTAVATNVTRKIRRFARNKVNEVVDQETEELVHIHGGYRPHMDGEKQTRKAFFFRGARVWREA